ncbi:glycosyltransferase family 2 protein [Thioclava sp. JE_KL1]|uniref:glycosyltransferase family 2 protein n=1 Tax=Thioclava sp. JE_KL1 TaxID=2651187 RepID=UPI00128B25AE|nr:glycosyltransferase family 2 protein [Thioclava sp. JE_KL1]MPQ95767.1 glycosyltransferase [Thioclava sp. JE_KL1]
MKISLITAVYDAEDTVGDAIASVARQSHRDLEHLIIEGRSRDGSFAAIEAARHSRMIAFSEADAGLYDALNKGIARATGEVVGFVHADDMLAHRDALAHVAAAFADPQVEAVFANLDYVLRGDPDTVIRHWANGGFTPAKLRRGWAPAHPTLYLRCSTYARLGGFNTSYRIAADYDFMLRVFSALQGRAVYLPELLYKMRLGGVSNRSLAHLRRKMAEDYRAIRANHLGGPVSALGVLARKNLSKLRQFVERDQGATTPADHALLLDVNPRKAL